MKVLVCMVFFTVMVVNVTEAGFIPPIQERGFMPISNRWQTSLEESGIDLDHLAPEHHDEYEYMDQRQDLHLHEDHGHFEHEHFEDSEEKEYQPIVDAPVLHEPKEEKTIHHHEHHHHYHNHYKTLPISIIKKTVYYKHG